MFYLYRKLLNFILWATRFFTPSHGPTLDTTAIWKSPTKIDSGLGFPIDRWDSSVSFIHSLLRKIPIYDEDPTIDPSVGQAELNAEYGTRVPTEANDPSNLIDFFMNNTGSYFLKPVLSWKKSSVGSDSPPRIYIVDFSNYEQYNVRRGYERYGGKVYIQDGRIIRYEYLDKQYPPESCFMDKIIRATLCLKMMVELHALRVHLCTAQRKVYEYAQKYPSDHPLRDFLYLSTYATLDVNRRIPVLVSPCGLVSRLFGLAESSYQQLLNNILAQSEFSKAEILGVPGTVWYDELKKYYRLVRQFVNNLTNNKEEQIDLTNFFVSATALHNQFGDAQTYSMVISKFFLPKVYFSNPGWISPLDQNLLTTLLVAVTPRYPLIVDYNIKNVFSNKTHQRAWNRFVKEINKKYPPEDNDRWFNPQHFEISVGF